jgi:DNA mismatch endonuclease (patch repair protein)
MDTVSAEIRSRVMAKVRSQRNRSTEWRLRSALVRAGVRGWTLNVNEIPGTPDFVFLAERLAVFVDGCFWHGCPACKRIPSSNVEYWREKIERNRRRDRTVCARLKKDGWKVLRIWEHQLDRPDSLVARIRMLTDNGINTAKKPAARLTAGP